MNDRFAKDVDTLLSGLTWEQRDSNAVLATLRGEQPKMKHKLSLGLVLAIALVLLAAVALAIGLSFSPQFSAVRSARQAVTAKYGLSQEMLGLYSEQVSEDASGTTVHYYGNNSEFLKADRMGDYTAVVSANGSATATWSHDGADVAALQSGDVSAPVWGATQLQKVIDSYQTYQQWQKDTPDLYLLPLKQQAARLAQLDAMIAPFEVCISRTALPDAADIPEEDALTLARQALKQQFGVQADDGWRTERFLQIGENDDADNRLYTFYFQKGGDATPLQSYRIAVLARTGEVITDQLALDPLLSARKNAATASPAPTATTFAGLTQAQALQAAKQALNARYGLTEDMFTLFTAVPTLTATDQNPVWTVVFQPKDITVEQVEVRDWRWNDNLTPKLGSYTVLLDAVSGETRQASWSLAGVEDTAARTQNDWAGAKAYDAHILPWVMQLLAQNDAIIAKYPDDQTEWFSLADAAAYDQAFRDAGFDAGKYNHALPRNGDLTADQALMLARQAMQSEYSLTGDKLKDYVLTTEYVMDGGGQWWIGYYGADGMGDVKLNAATGEIENVYLDSAAAGNG